MIWDFKKFSQNVALIENISDTSELKSLSYDELFTFGQILYEQINKRTLTIILASNSFGSIIGYTSFVNHGVVPLMLSADISINNFKSFLYTYKPEFVWAPKNGMSNDFGTTIYESHGYKLLKTSFSAPSLHSELALLMTTSGSLGDSKLVRQSYKNILSNTSSITEFLNIDEHERAITTLPMNYTYGLSIINTHLFGGASIVLTNSTIMQREFWELLDRTQASSFGGVPYTYEMLDKLRFTNKNLPHLKTITQAGGKLSLELHEKFATYAKNTRKNFVVMYGQAEATARISYLPPQKALEKIGSIGVAIPKGKLGLIDDYGVKITKPKQTGELVYKGENVAMGYASTIRDLANGYELGEWLDTGDIAMVDEQGYYFVVGRKKRFIKLYGNRIGLDECERAIKSTFGDIDVACVGEDEKMNVFITKKDLCTEIKNFLGHKTGINQKGFNIKFIDQIPRNTAGKILYAELRHD